MSGLWWDSSLLELMLTFLPKTVNIFLPECEMCVCRVYTSFCWTSAWYFACAFDGILFSWWSSHAQTITTQEHTHTLSELLAQLQHMCFCWLWLASWLARLALTTSVEVLLNLASLMCIKNICTFSEVFSLLCEKSIQDILEIIQTKFLNVS